MLILLLFTLVVAAGVEPVAPQAPRPDFSGVWQVDSEASKALTEKNGQQWRVGGASVGGSPGGSRQTPIRVETLITHTSSELIVQQKYGEEITSREVHKLDGSESVNATSYSTSKARTVWKGHSLVTTGSMHMDLTGQATRADGTPIKEINRTFVTTRTLQSDGTMIVESRTTQDGTERVHWRVYRRVRSS